jgi:glutamine synthetase
LSKSTRFCAWTIGPWAFRRIPRHIAEAGCGYLEDRRPNANADPYEVAARLLRTICGIE